MTMLCEIRCYVSYLSPAVLCRQGHKPVENPAIDDRPVKGPIAL